MRSYEVVSTVVIETTLANRLRQENISLTICGGLAIPDRPGPGRRKHRRLMLNMCYTKMLRHDGLGLRQRILAADTLNSKGCPRDPHI